MQRIRQHWAPPTKLDDNWDLFTKMKKSKRSQSRVPTSTRVKGHNKPGFIRSDAARFISHLKKNKCSKCLFLFKIYFWVIGSVIFLICYITCLFMLLACLSSLLLFTSSDSASFSFSSSSSSTVLLGLSVLCCSFVLLVL